MLHLAHLLLGTVRIGSDEPPGELGLQHDHRQGVTEQVVQVTCDALALGDRGQPLDLLVRATQPGLHALAFAVNDPTAALITKTNTMIGPTAGSPRQGNRGDQEHHPGEPGQHGYRGRPA